MLQNRSMPASTVIPVLAYASVPDAIAWLSAAFGFTLRLGIGEHRAQLNAGDDGAIVITGGAGPTSRAAVIRSWCVSQTHAPTAIARRLTARRSP